MRIKLTTWLLKMGISFNKSEALVDLMKELLDEFGSEGIKSLTLSNTTSSKIARECISATYKEEIFKDIIERPFSLSFDECSDKYGPACLCTHVKYVKQEEICHKLLSLDEIGESATGEELYNIVMNSVFKGREEVLKRNLIGICTDKGSNMISPKEKGLTNRIKKDCPQIIVIHDFSHLFNLVSASAIKKFPSESISLIKQISAHFSRSSLRRAKLKRIQSDLRENDFNQFYQVLTYTPTRWISLMAAAERILLIWKPLQYYFEEEGDIDISLLLEKKNKAYLELLVFFLNKINILIKYFESNAHDYSVILPKLRNNLILWAQFIFKEDIINKTSQEEAFSSLISLKCETFEQLQSHLTNLQVFENRFLSKYPEFSDIYEGITNESKIEFYSIAKDFITQVFFEMRRRIPFNEEILNESEALKLKEIDSNNPQQWTLFEKQWNNLFRMFKNHIHLSKGSHLSDELMNFRFHYNELKGLQANCNNMLGFWNQQRAEYPIMWEIAVNSLTLPYSSAEIERTFSHLRDIRLPKRNRLGVEAVEAYLFVRKNLGDIENFQISPEMQARYAQMWAIARQEKPNISPAPQNPKESQNIERGENNLIEEIKEEYAENANNGSNIIEEETNFPQEKGTQDGKRKEPIQVFDRNEHGAPLKKGKMPRL